MKTYIGTKIIKAEPESKLDLGGELAGYKVVYEDGYTSWSPKATFEASYQELSVLTRSCLCSTRPSEQCKSRCYPGAINCNNYCQDNKVKAPMTYEIVLFDFSEALRQIKAGNRVSRLGWNGKGMWLSLCTTWSGGLLSNHTPQNTPMPDAWAGNAPFIALYAADHRLVPWHASQTDI